MRDSQLSDFVGVKAGVLHAGAQVHKVTSRARPVKEGAREKGKKGINKAFRAPREGSRKKREREKRDTESTRESEKARRVKQTVQKSRIID
jgi:hypothetical protein